ncbi:hypothetical protein MLD38_035160 [Melastoma candidum]|uniref:Uncharacterized protein n=1 Tax=Melastoma candidum TaxID=119954 RepID=A0ACB9MFF5_9MYRT|nr:hypothetical protein MLD38_035160 [Melastoma candidum]
MGPPGGCFWSIFNLKKPKPGKEDCSSGCRIDGGDKNVLGTSGGERIEDVAAVRIQAAVRAFLAKKRSRHEKCAEKFHGLTRGPSVREQATSTLCYLHEWSRIQSEIRARRVHMVTEARLKQKKLENQLKFEAKLHKLEVEWCGGPGTLEEILAKLYQREEAASKRERALAYAFAHQWRADSGNYLGRTSYYLDKDLGWSWMERWLAVRPWEVRVQPDRKGPVMKQQNRPAKSHENFIPNRSVPPVRDT